MIYLDNSSTTHKKPICVKYNVLRGLYKLSVNPSRSSYDLAIKGGRIILDTREKLATYLGGDSDKVIFTSGCTHALNLAILGTAKNNGHIVTTIYEHNSVLRVLDKLKETHNISVTYVEPYNGTIRPNDIAKAIKSNTYLVIVNHTSNVTGSTQNIVNIGKICKKQNILFLVDGAQSVGHEKIDIKKMNINMLTVAGHKGLYSPTGIGALLLNNVSVSPIIMGGTGTNSFSTKQPTDYPEGLESGTPNMPGILGLNAGISFVMKHQEKINNKIYNLSSYLMSELNKIKNIDIFGNAKSGVVSIRVRGKTSTDIVNYLSEKNICVRGGLHCAPLIHKYLGTLKDGLTRISISYYNKKRDINKLIKHLKDIALS